MRVHLFELLGSSERKWGVAGVWKIYPVELQERARLHFPYTTYYHVESVLQKRLKRQDHPLLIVSISIYNITVLPNSFCESHYLLQIYSSLPNLFHNRFCSGSKLEIYRY